MPRKRHRASRPLEAAAASVASQADAQASDAASVGMDLLRAAAERKSGVAPGLLQGNLFEYIEWTKLATDAARKGISLGGSVTAAQGLHTAPADIVVTFGGTERAFQLKSWENLRTVAKFLAQPKYDGMGLIVPRDQVDALREAFQKLARENPELAGRFQDAASRLRSSIDVGGAQSGGSTRAELQQAAEAPERFAALFEAKVFAREVASSAAAGAAAGMVVRGALAAAQGILDVRRGRCATTDALRRTGAAGVSGAARGAAVGATSAVVRLTATKAGLRVLAKANVAAAVANCALDVGSAVIDFARGRASVEATTERIGVSGGSTLASVYSGAAAGAFFGPPGVLVGGLAGFLIASQVLQTCTTLHRHAKLLEQEAARVEHLELAASLVLEEQRRWMRDELEPRLQTVHDVVVAAFDAAEQRLAANDVAGLTVELAALVDVFGQALPFASFEEFDAFMKTDEPLRL